MNILLAEQEKEEKKTEKKVLNAERLSNKILFRENHSSQTLVIRWNVRSGQST